MEDKTVNSGYPIQETPGPQKDTTPEVMKGTFDPGSVVPNQQDDTVSCEVKVAEADAVTKNGNIYPKEVLKEAMEEGAQQPNGEAEEASQDKDADTSFTQIWLEPKWFWWRNKRGEWGCTAIFEDAGNSEKKENLLCTMIHYDVHEDRVEYKAEVDFHGRAYLSEPLVVQRTKDADDAKEEIGRGSQPSGSYVPELDEDQTEPPVPQDPKAIESEDDPLNDVSQANLNQLLKQVGNMVKIMENNWMISRRDFQLTDDHMKALYKFNSDHAEPMPANLSKEEKDKWDHFNGLDKLTEEDVEEIFGKDHPIIGIEHTVTMDRIKSVVGDYFSWHYAMNEYKKVHDAYVQLIESEEEKNIQALKEMAETEEDPEKKKKMEDAIELYYHRKYLGFLADEMDEQVKKRLASAWKDARKIEYWMKRSRDKLTRMKISNQVIFEIADFERRFMEEKYHRIYNILLLYFLNIVTYCKPDDHSDPNRNMAVCMVFGLDSVIRKTATPEVTEKIMNNVRGFLDQMLDYIKEEDQGE